MHKKLDSISVTHFCYTFLLHFAILLRSQPCKSEPYIWLQRSLRVPIIADENSTLSN